MKKDWNQDEIHHHLQTKLNFVDRIRVLCGATIYADVQIKTENLPGHVEGQSKVWIGRVFPVRQLGAAEARESPELVR